MSFINIGASTLMNINEILNPPLYVENAGICNVCGKHTAMEVNGTLQQPCASCALDKENNKIRQKLLTARLADYKGMMDRKYLDYEWSVFNSGIREQQFCARTCKRWSDSYQLGKWLLIRGKKGTGKTIIKNLIIKDFCTNRKCTMMSTKGITIYEKYLEVCKENRQLELLRYYTSVDLLIIDEVGRNPNGDNFKDFFYDIIDSFYDSNKSMILISNFELLRKDNIDGRFISDYIDVERINEKCEIVDFNYNTQRGK